jgi:hypothetical protein
MMKKVTVRVDSRNRISLTKVSKKIAQSFYAYEKDGKIILEPVAEIPAHEAWLYEPENKQILGQLKKALKQKGTITFDEFVKKHEITFKGKKR